MSAPAQTDAPAPTLMERLVGRFNESTKEEGSAPRPDTETARLESEDSQPEQQVTSEVSQETAPESGKASEAESAEPEAEAKAAEGTEGEVAIEDDSDLAEFLGASPEDLRAHLKVTVGEEKIPLSELISRASAAPLPQQVHEAISHERGQIQQLAQAMGQRFAELEASALGLTNMLLDRVMGDEYSDATMAQLKEESPQDFLIRSEEKRQMQATIDKVIGQAQQHRKALEAVRTPAQQAYDMEQAQDLSRSLEGWSDPKRAEWEATIIGRFLQEHYQIPPDLIESPGLRHAGICKAFYDAHRLHRILADADKTKTTLKAKKESARKSVVPTRARRPAENQRVRKFAELRKLQRNSARDPSKAAENTRASREALAMLLPD